LYDPSFLSACDMLARFYYAFSCSSVVLPLVTVWACIQTVVYSRSDVSRWLKGFVLIFIVLQLMVAAYLAYFSAAGIVSWT